MLALALLALAYRKETGFPWWRFLALTALILFFWTPWRLVFGTVSLVLIMMATWDRFRRPPRLVWEQNIDLIEVVVLFLFYWTVRPL